MEVIFVLMAIFLILFFMGSYQWVFLFLLLSLYVFLVNASHPKPMEPTVGTEISPWFDRQRIQNWNPSVPVID